MNDKLQMSGVASVELIRAPRTPQGDGVNPKGRYKIEHFRDGKKIGEYEAVNTTTNEGRAKLLNVMFDGATPITAWYLGLAITSATFAATDNYANSPAALWAELTDYAGNRQAWTVTTATTANPAVITNTASVATFTINNSYTITGLILVGGGSAAATKGDQAGGGVLWSGAAFSGGSVTAVANDVLKVTYQVQAGA